MQGLLVLAILVLLAIPAHAAELAPLLADYTLSTWSQRDGLPAGTIWTLAQDRLTKSVIYAAAGVADYWIVNLRDGVVEWFREPDRLGRGYGARGVARGNENLSLSAFPAVHVRATDLLPPA